MDSLQVLRSLVVVLVVVSCPHVSCMPAKISESDTMVLAEIVRCQLWSMHSGRFIGVNPDKSLHAMGQSDDARTVFVPRHNSEGKIVFQMACYPDQFIIYQNMTARVGSPSNDNEYFDQHTLFGSIVAYQSTHIEDDQCYIAFDGHGYPYDDMCLEPGHKGTLIRYFDYFEQIDCDEADLPFRSMMKEL